MLLRTGNQDGSDDTSQSSGASGSRIASSNRASAGSSVMDAHGLWEDMATRDPGDETRLVIDESRQAIPAPAVSNIRGSFRIDRDGPASIVMPAHVFSVDDGRRRDRGSVPLLIAQLADNAGDCPDSASGRSGLDGGQHGSDNINEDASVSLQRALPSFPVRVAGQMNVPRVASLPFFDPMANVQTSPQQGIDAAYSTILARLSGSNSTALEGALVKIGELAKEGEVAAGNLQVIAAFLAR
ncbi:hypothetical protein HDU96_000654 [Phlyctochytrium bullatum]|nr:hypothetical protein HDU96_000654 [Phlyctochytrium bullatum]